MFTDNQYIVSMHNHLYPKDSWPVRFWSTTILVIGAMDEIALSHSHSFRQQFTACRSIYWFLITIPDLPYHSSSSCFFSISTTYYKPFLPSQLCAPGLSRELCSWMHGLQQHDGCQSYRFVLHTIRSVHDSDNITDWNFISQFRLEINFCFSTFR